MGAAERLSERAVADAVAAVRSGDQRALAAALAEHPTLVAGPLPGHGGRSLLHVATDWPGRRPNVATTAFAQWDAARLLVERRATVSLFDAAALGMTDRVAAALGSGEVDSAGALLWGACHGGRLETASLLVEAGADPAWLGWDGLTPLGAAERSGATEVVAWLREHGATHGG